MSAAVFTMGEFKFDQSLFPVRLFQADTCHGSSFAQAIDRIGFLQLDNGLYENTEKGRKFLEMYAQFSSKHARLRKELEAYQSELEVLERFYDPATNNG